MIGNLERLEGRDLFLVSDDTEQDGALEQLLKRFALRSDIVLLGRRDLAKG